MDNVKKISEEFTARVFGNEIPSNLCFSTCFPLSLLLDTKQIKHSISCGDYSKDGKSIPHVWLILDNDGTILDPTIRQFDESMDSVYLGNLTENEVTKYYIQVTCSFKEWFDHSYYTWTAPLLNTQPRTLRPEGFEKKMNYLNVKTATVLYGLIGNNAAEEQFMQTNKFKYYFSPILKFLSEKYETDKNFIDSLTNSMPKDFKLLLSKALVNN